MWRRSKDCPPAISIDQKSTNRNPRSTVGTVTEIYDYFRLLYASIGIPHCPKCGKEIEKQTVDQMVDADHGTAGTHKDPASGTGCPRTKGRTCRSCSSRQKKAVMCVSIVDGNMYELSEEIQAG